MAKARKKSARRKKATRPRRARKATRAKPKKRKARARKPARRARPKAKAAARTAAAKRPAPEPGEKLAGVVTHFFPHVQAAAIKLTQGRLAVGETVHIKGHTTDFKQTIESLQIEHQAIDSAKKGDEIGLRVRERVRIHDQVFKRKST